MSFNTNAKAAAVSPAAFATQTVEAANPPKVDLTLNMNDLNRAALPSPAFPPAAAAAYAQPQQRAYAAGATAAPAGGFRATVPPSPAHGASTAILGSGSHQEMTLPLSEAAPELFGGNPAASTPHYDALAAAGTAAAAPAQYAAAAMPSYGGAANPIYAGAAPAAMSSYGGGIAATAAPAAGGLVATVPPSPAHAGSTAMLGSGSHQEMVLPLSEAAPELFGGNPAASTPHYDAVGAAETAMPMQPAAAAAPFISSAPVTATPMNYGAAAAGAAMPMNYGAVPPSPSGGLRATVPPSPAHAASTTMLGSGSHQEMVLPLSEAAPELFGGNPAASTPHYDAMAAPDMGAPGLAAAAAYMGGAVTPAAGPAVLPPIASSSIAAMPGINQPNLTLGMGAPAPAMAGMPTQFPHITGFNSVVPPSPAHGASSTVLPEGGHQEMVLPLSEAAPELFGGNPGASTPHYDAVMGL